MALPWRGTTEIHLAILRRLVLSQILHPKMGGATLVGG